MKPALHWTLHSGWYGYRPIAVTLEKGNRVYGRDEWGNGTHARKSDTVGIFPDKEAANAKVVEIERIKMRCAERRKTHESAIADIRADEEREIKELLRADRLRVLDQQESAA
jgi:hypothetical protein